MSEAVKFRVKEDFEELLVDGYIRNIQQMMTKIIPMSIITICYDYHGVMDYFSIAGKNVDISEDCLMATRKDDTLDDYDNTSYGTKWMNSTEKMVIKWTLRILFNEVYGVGIFIGITNNDSFANNAFYDDGKIENNIYYAYQNEQQLYSSHKDDGIEPGFYVKEYGDEYGKDDIIMMELNLKEATLQYYKNGEPQGIACKNIIKDENIKYKLMVSMFSERDSIQIINFQKTKC